MSIAALFSQFVESDLECVKANQSFSSSVLSAVSDVSEFRDQNKKNYDLIKTKQSSKKDKREHSNEEFLVSLFSKTSKSADDKIVESMQVYCDKKIEELEYFNFNFFCFDF